MTTRRDFLYAGVVVAPGLLLTGSMLHALVRPSAESPATQIDGGQVWPRKPVGRQTFNFNQGWRFYREDAGRPAVAVSPDNRLNTLKDSEWEVVNLPHTVRLEPLNASGGRRTVGITISRSWPDTEYGELRAEGLIGGKVAASYDLLAPGTPTQIKLTLDHCGRDLVADGSDWIRVYAHVCDARGATYPYGDDIITFTVSGEGSVIGDASIGANPMRAEAGIATALIRATTKPGTITVRAFGFGLSPTEQEIKSIAMQSLVWPW